MTIADDEELPESDELRIPKEALARLSAEELRDSGILLEVNRRVLHPLGLALAVDLEANSIEILDDRSDPEGWYFEELDDDETRAKLENVARLEAERRPAREHALGYWIQPRPTDG